MTWWILGGYLVVGVGFAVRAVWWDWHWQKRLSDVDLVVATVTVVIWPWLLWLMLHDLFVEWRAECERDHL